jgi:hypothetical protein
MGGATAMAALVQELVAVLRVLTSGHAAAAAGAVTLRPALRESAARSAL